MCAMMIVIRDRVKSEHIHGDDVDAIAAVPRPGLRRRAARDAVRRLGRRAPPVRRRGAARHAELAHRARLGARLRPRDVGHLPLEPARRRRPPLAQPPPPVGSACVLSGSPADDGAAAGFTVVLCEPGQSTVLWYCHSGGGGAAAWTRHEYDLGYTATVRVPGGECRHKKTIYCLASCRGRFFYLHSGTHYGEIDFPAAAPPAFSTVPVNRAALPIPRGEVMATASMYSLDIDGELHMVYVMYRGDHGNVGDVGVYRVDFERQEHVRVAGVGDRAILAGSNGGFGGWCPATEFGLRRAASTG
ncbi:hypothetical protein ACP4OV_017186 [Aristida adscensionis]